MGHESKELMGVLVGWTSDDLGDKVMLNLQSIDRAGPVSPEDISSLRLLMTKSQAVVLGNYLFQISGQTPPQPRRRGLLRNLLFR